MKQASYLFCFLPLGILPVMFENVICFLFLGVGQHRKVEKCKVLVANTPMDTDKIKIYGARVKVDSFEAVAELEEAERQKMKQKVRICLTGRPKHLPVVLTSEVV